MKIMIGLLAALLLLVTGCAHPAAVGGSTGDNLEGYSTSYTQAPDSPVQDYVQILSDPGPF